ncbi:MAG: DUF4062 domain-containing protein [Pseudomonadota bacterium]
MPNTLSSDQKTALALMTVPQNVFISGTYEELVVYREHLAQGIAAAGHIPVEPHHTGGALWPLCAKLAVQIQAHCQAYFGFFGERYGTPVSEGDEDARSYTEYEFDLALEAYCSPGRPPPIFVMMPDMGSELWHEIRARTGEVIAEKKLSRREQAADLKLQDAFLKKVEGGVYDGKPASNEILPVKTRAEIPQRAKTTLFNYYNDLAMIAEILEVQPRSASPFAATSVPEPAPQVLGEPRLIRQTNALFETYQTDGYKASPLLAILVQAPQHRAAPLAKTVKELADNHIPWGVSHKDEASFDEGRRTHYTVEEALWNMLDLAPPRGDSAAQIRELAEHVIAREARLVLELQAVNRYPGQLKALMEECLIPLTAALLEAKPATPQMVQQLTLIMSYRGDVFGDQKAMSGYLSKLTQKTRPDFRKLLVLSLPEAQKGTLPKR